MKEDSGPSARGGRGTPSPGLLAPVPIRRDYREIVELAPVRIFHSTVDGKFLVVNEAFARMLGYDSPAELLRMDIPGTSTSIETTGADPFVVRADFRTRPD
jgi:PAS domain-containing protein